MRGFWDFRSSITLQYNDIDQLGESHIQGITKRCRLSWLINSALVYEAKCGGRGGVAALRGSQSMSTAIHSKLWRSNSICNLCD
jgi:hypothetical protein